MTERIVLRRRLRWTAWLTVPGLLGALPVLGVFVAMHGAVHAIHAFWKPMPDKALEIGAAAPVLVVLGFFAINRRFRAMRTWRRLRRRAEARTSA